MKTTARFAAAALAVVAMTACAAFTRAETRVISVQHSDLDLSTTRDTTRLATRMFNAMVNVCGERPSPNLIERTINYADCKATLTLDPGAADKAAMTSAFAKAKGWLD